MSANKGKQIGVQLWSVREDAKKDLPGTLRALASMGYAGVELAGTYDVPAAQWATELKKTGLVAASAHVPLPELGPDRRAATFDFYRQIGCRNLVVPALPAELRADLAGYERAADMINEAGGPAAAAGFRLGYHNHAFEFEPAADGRAPYHVLVARLRPETILEIDLGWAFFAGVNGADLVRRYPGRETIVHVKAFAKNNETAVLGEDDVPWAKVLQVCATVGKTEWYIVEHERYANPPMVCVKQCLDYLRTLQW